MWALALSSCRRHPLPKNTFAVGRISARKLVMNVPAVQVGAKDLSPTVPKIEMAPKTWNFSGYSETFTTGLASLGYHIFNLPSGPRAKHSSVREDSCVEVVIPVKSAPDKPCAFGLVSQPELFHQLSEPEIHLGQKVSANYPCRSSFAATIMDIQISRYPGTAAVLVVRHEVANVILPCVSMDRV